MKTVWKRTPNGGRVILLLGVAALAVVTIFAARRDLAVRDRSAIRGDPEVWDRVTRMPGGAITYLVAGRRPTARTA